MSHSSRRGPETWDSLLLRIKEGDKQAWEDFVDVYTPVVYWECRRSGLRNPMRTT